MLSYQHIYHAGNPADLHKHMLLAWALDYMCRKDKPLSYIETHAGRGLYHLDAAEALKTGEALAGIGRVHQALPADHPYTRAIASVQARHGATAYPGSPLIAAQFLRRSDQMTLAELHPREHAALVGVMAPYRADLRQVDGLHMLRALIPPTPRRGLVMIDPSYEVKTDYDILPDTIASLRRKWPVGVILLWYPRLTTGAQDGMLARMRTAHPDAAFFDLDFPPVRPGHRMIGSGLAVLNPPFGMAEEAARVRAFLTPILSSS